MSGLFESRRGKGKKGEKNTKTGEGRNSEWTKMAARVVSPPTPALPLYCARGREKTGHGSAVSLLFFYIGVAGLRNKEKRNEEQRRLKVKVRKYF